MPSIDGRTNRTYCQGLTEAPSAFLLALEATTKKSLVPIPLRRNLSLEPRVVSYPPALAKARLLHLANERPTPQLTKKGRVSVCGNEFNQYQVKTSIPLF